MNEKIAALCNEQINKEFYSAYLYLDIADFFEEKGLDGFANWYFVQAREEQDHGMMFLRYMQDNGCKVTLEAIEKPDKEFTDPRSALEVGYEHEKYVTGLIYAIYDAAHEAKDFRTMQFLDWFVKEQGEEERNASDMLTKYGLYGSDPKGLYALNSELAARVYVAPAGE